MLFGQAASVQIRGGRLAGDEEQAEDSDLAPVKPVERANGHHHDRRSDDRADIEQCDARELAHAPPS
jgi:hypothetical protein